MAGQLKIARRRSAILLIWFLWRHYCGLGTIGTTDPNDPNKGFRGLCKVLLGKPFDFEKIQCTGSSTNNPTPIPNAAPTKKNMKKPKRKKMKKQK